MMKNTDAKADFSVKQGISRVCTLWHQRGVNWRTGTNRNKKKPRVSSLFDGMYRIG